MRARASVAVAALAALAACKTRWHSQTVQPGLLLGPDPVGRTSLVQSITLHDMHLPSWVNLSNTAYVVLVTRDRIRARVRFVHRWKSMTDMDRWKAWLEDETGRRLYPSAVEKRATRPIYEIVIPDVNWRNGRATGFAHRYPVNLYDGGGDYVFYRRGFYRKDMKQIALVLERRNYQFRYTWRFARAPDGDVARLLDRDPEFTVGFVAAR